jgi:DNA polymerase-1
MVLLLVDGNSIMNRAFYGIRTLTTKTGLNTNAVYGFMNILIRNIEDYKPDAVAVAFDVNAPTFRHDMFEGYKAGRHATPPELLEQFPYIKDILHAFGIKTVEIEGYEADDVIGTLANANADKSFIVSGDRDTLQLISDKSTVLLQTTRDRKPTTLVYDEAALFGEYGLTPNEMIELKALMGDPSDKIPGVKGVGEKTALELIKTYHSVDTVYESLDDIKPTVAKKLEADKDNAYLSKTLGTISNDVPISVDIADYKIKAPDKLRLQELLSKFELNQLLSKFNIEKIEIKSADAEEKDFELKICDFEEFADIAEKQNPLYLYAEYSDKNIVTAYTLVDDFVYKLENDSFLSENAILDVLKNAENIITDDSKALYAYSHAYDIDIKAKIFDTKLAAYLISPDRKSYDLEILADEYSINYHNCDDCEALKVTYLPILFEKLTEILKEREQEKLLYEIEIPLAKVLSSMEHIGFSVDEQGIVDFQSQIEEEIDVHVKKIYEQAGREFNINSPKQLGQVLFEELGLPAKKKTKTGYSTNADVLEDLAVMYPIVADILEYRTLAKLKSTYCEGLLSKIGKNGRIYSTFNQTETRTGRISSSEPNLQNIPVRTKLGAQMRKFFTASDGCVLVDADYSQIELRVLASIANDEKMINAFKEGVDIHKVTASQVFDMPFDFVTNEMRSRAKAINFGIVYGMGAFTLSRDIKVSVKEAGRYINSYLSHYSGIKKYLDNCVEDAKEKGYVTTLFNRRRYLPELNDSNAMQRKFGERVAKNMPIQGTAADIIKIAMINVYNRLKAENLEARLILQVHDELIVESPENEVEQVKDILRQEMENAAKLKVNLVVDVNIGKTWYESKG